MPASLHFVSFWLNAFIPRDVLGATTMLLQGEYKGLTALSGSPRYLTDQRDFSNDLRASSRMHSFVNVDFTTSEPVLTQHHRCDDLIRCDPATGEVLNKDRVGTSKMTFSFAATSPNILIQMDCRYGDARSVAGHGIGEIEYKGTIEFDPSARSIDIDLMICLFPAFEGYAAINDGGATVLFRHAPPVGILTVGPPRGAKRRIRARLDDEFFAQHRNEYGNDGV